MSERAERTIFMHPVIGGGRATLALIRVGDHYAMGVAWCSPKDRFERKKGRLIAEGRARRSLNLFSVPSDGEGWFHRLHDAALSCLATLCELGNVPKWVKRRFPTGLSVTTWLDFMSYQRTLGAR